MNEVKFASKDELLKSSTTIKGGCTCQSGSCGGGRIL